MSTFLQPHLRKNRKSLKNMVQGIRMGRIRCPAMHTLHGIFTDSPGAVRGSEVTTAA